MEPPLVYLVIDRSSSMFASDGLWGDFREAVLAQIDPLAPSLDLAFGTFTGSTESCTGLTEHVALTRDGYEAIASTYRSLAQPEFKGESPAALAVQQAAATLLEVPGERVRVILLLASTRPDFCNDLAPECGADGSIASLQDAAARGVTTKVFALDQETDPEQSDYFRELLDYLATAGAGLRPHWPMGLETHWARGPYEFCHLDHGWGSYRELRGTAQGTEPAGVYSTEDEQISAVFDQSPEVVATAVGQELRALSACE